MLNAFLFTLFSILASRGLCEPAAQKTAVGSAMGMADPVAMRTIMSDLGNTDPGVMQAILSDIGMGTLLRDIGMGTLLSDIGMGDIGVAQMPAMTVGDLITPGSALYQQPMGALNVLKGVDDVTLATLRANAFKAMQARAANIDHLKHVYYKKSTVLNAKNHLKAGAQKATAAMIDTKAANLVKKQKALNIASARNIRRLRAQKVEPKQEFYGWYGGFGPGYYW